MNFAPPSFLSQYPCILLTMSLAVFGDFNSGTMVEDFRNANTMFGDISSGNTQWCMEEGTYYQYNLICFRPTVAHITPQNTPKGKRKKQGQGVHATTRFCPIAPT